jgi:hypothetical protein
VKRTVLLASAAAVYLVAAWMVAPGFYDGFAPQPYNWTSPPPPAVAGNMPPRSGHLVIKVLNGVSDAASAFTEDGQVVIGFNFGVFDATGKTSITVDIKPESTFPAPTGLHFATNVYLITADAPSIKDANLLLRYSDLVPAPSTIYQADAGGPWKAIGGADTQSFAMNTNTGKLGYFAAGYPANATSRTSSGASQLLPIAVAVLIVGVLVAGIPLAFVRRRRAGGGVEEEEPDEDDEG